MLGRNSRGLYKTRVEGKDILGDSRYILGMNVQLVHAAEGGDKRNI